MAKNAILEAVKIIKNNHLSNEALDLQFNAYMRNHAIVYLEQKPIDPKKLEEAKGAQLEARNALWVLYSLLNMKPNEREAVISAVRKIKEPQFGNEPGEAEINPAQIDSAVLYSIKDILYPKKVIKSPKKAA